MNIKHNLLKSLIGAAAQIHAAAPIFISLNKVILLPAYLCSFLQLDFSSAFTYHDIYRMASAGHSHYANARTVSGIMPGVL